VLTDAVLEVGLDTLTGGRPAFLNLTKPLITSKVATLLPPEGGRVRAARGRRVDDTVVEACRDLHARGYRLRPRRLRRRIGGRAADAVRLVREDRRAAHRHAARAGAAAALQAARVDDGGRKGRDARGVRGHEEGRLHLFQGYYFRRPVIQTGKALPANHATYMRLLAELNREDLTILELEALIKQDAALSLKVLRCVNSAGAAAAREVRSIHDAVVLLGIKPIRSGRRCGAWRASTPAAARSWRRWRCCARARASSWPAI
jgi:EAL and modified HD-GYP domain-containing signal transduction protein